MQREEPEDQQGEQPAEPADQGADDTAGDSAETGTDDDAAWAAIVANFGERAVLEPTGDPDPPAVDPDVLLARGTGSVAQEDEEHPELVERPDRADRADEVDRFVPDPPPPVPIPPLDRFAAWLGVFGSPTVLLVFLVLGISLPTWLGWLLVGGFVLGFCYLVFRMPRSPRDPWDDGARV